MSIFYTNIYSPQIKEWLLYKLKPYIDNPIVKLNQVVIIPCLGFYGFENTFKEYIEIENSLYIHESCLLYKIDSFFGGFGTLGLYGKLGYNCMYGAIETNRIVGLNGEEQTLSCHVPSSICIKVDKAIYLSGYCSLTAEKCFGIKFTCNGVDMGTIIKAGQKTLKIKLQAGTYRLETKSMDSRYGHSVWLLTPCKAFTKYIKTNFDMPLYGLNNHIFNLINSIIIAEQTGRFVCNPTCCVDYTRMDFIAFSTILNIEALNKKLIEMHMDTQILEIHDKFWVDSSNYGKKPKFTLFEDVRDTVEKEKDVYLNHGNVMSAHYERPESIKRIENVLFKNLVLTNPYQSIVDYCINSIAKPFSAVHLRLEDDWIQEIGPMYCKDGDYSEYLKSAYTREMQKQFLPDTLVFLATNLCKAENTNNSFIPIIRQSFTILPFINWRQKFSVPIGRELDALIDMFICLKAEKFIGIGFSSFSTTISRIKTEHCTIISHIKH